MEQLVVSGIVLVLLGFKSGIVSNQRHRFAGHESGIVNDKRHDVGGLESETVISVVGLLGLKVE